MTTSTAHFSVALLAFDDMEALDFAGPFEVFTTASRVARKRFSAPAAQPGSGADPKDLFSVSCVARSLAPVKARAGLRVLPDADFAQCPHADLLLVPGGVVDAAQACPQTLAWVRHLHVQSPWTASVCTGAFILAAAGVLTDEPCTTHWEDLVDLRTQFPALQVQGGVRWVEAQQGRLVTSAGISAGIDMSLHLVARMAASLGWDGTALAEATARQMDYPWVRA